jgi:hypothetical protein
MLSVHTLLSLLLLERLAGPRAATRVLLLCVGITVAPALLLGAWLCGSLAWQWGSRTWDDAVHRARPVAQWQAPVPDLTTPDAQVRRAQPAGDAQRAGLPDLSVRRGQAIDDMRTVRHYAQDGPARDACLRIPVDLVRPLPERTLLALEAACHPLALRVQAGDIQQRTLAEVLYGPLPAAAPRQP